MPNPTDFLKQLGLGHLLPGFIERRREELVELERLFAAQDWAEMRRLGHSLKGAAGNFGLPEFGEIGARLEDAADRVQIDKLREALIAYAQELRRFESPQA